MARFVLIADFRREIPTDTVTPWSHIQCPRRCDAFVREYTRMHEALAD